MRSPLGIICHERNNRCGRHFKTLRSGDEDPCYSCLGMEAMIAHFTLDEVNQEDESYILAVY